MFAFRIWDAQFEIWRFEIMKTDRNGLSTLNSWRCWDFTPKAEMCEGFGTSILQPRILEHHIPERPKYPCRTFARQDPFWSGHRGAVDAEVWAKPFGQEQVVLTMTTSRLLFWNCVCHQPPFRLTTDWQSLKGLQAPSRYASRRRGSPAAGGRSN